MHITVDVHEGSTIMDWQVEPFPELRRGYYEFGPDDELVDHWLCEELDGALCALDDAITASAPFHPWRSVITSALRAADA